MEKISLVASSKKILIPDKLYFKIGEVCEITGTKSHTLRFWESEFKVIRPKRISGNQRLYRKVDIEKILLIKHLIYVEGHTLAGAKKFLKREQQQKAEKKQLAELTPDSGIIKRIKTDLSELKEILEK